MSNTTTFQVEGMTCAHCEQSIREEVGAITGVDTIEVSAASGVLTVSHPEVEGSPDFTEAITAAVAEAGYAATPKQPERENLLADSNTQDGCCGGSCCAA